MRTYSKFVGILALLLLTATPSDAEVKYSIEYLGYFEGIALNNNGEVAGNSGKTGVIWSKGNLTYLPTIDGSSNYITDMNDRGDVVGYYIPQNGESHAFLYSGGEISTLKNLDGNTSADGINNYGQIAGNSFSEDGTIQGFLYEQGSVKNLVKSNSNIIVAKKINSSGEIVGHYITSVDGLAHAFVYRNGEVKDLGTLEGASFAVDINDAGQIVGSSYIQGGGIQHAFLYENDSMIDIGKSYSGNSYATSINNQSEIVGVEYPLGIIFSDGGIIELNQLIDNTTNLKIGGAYAVNDKGQILAGGYYDYKGGVRGSFLLTPIPEPSVFVLLASSIFALTIFILHKFGKSY
jgi:probable HAF family extracellular repeat protein